MSGRDTKPDASGACAPWPRHPGFRRDLRRRSGEAPDRLPLRRAHDLAALDPHPRKTRNLLAWLCPSAATPARVFETLPLRTSPPCRPTWTERFIRNRPVADRTAEPRLRRHRPLRDRLFENLGPGCSARAHPAGYSRLSPDAPPSGEGTDTGVERRAPEGVEVVPEALFPSSATTVSFEAGALPGFQAAVRPNRTSSARRVPGRSFSERQSSLNNNRQVKAKFLLTEFQYLHIPRTKYPRVYPQLLVHRPVDINKPRVKSLTRPAVRREPVAAPVACRGRTTRFAGAARAAAAGAEHQSPARAWLNSTTLTARRLAV